MKKNLEKKIEKKDTECGIKLNLSDISLYLLKSLRYWEFHPHNPTMLIYDNNPNVKYKFSFMKKGKTLTDNQQIILNDLSFMVGLKNDPYAEQIININLHKRLNIKTNLLNRAIIYAYDFQN